MQLKNERRGRGQNPIDPFAVLEPQNPLIYKAYKAQKRRKANFKALKVSQEGEQEEA